MRNSLAPHFFSLTVRKVVLRLILISCLFAFVVYLTLGIQDLVHRESIFRGCLHIGITIIPILVLVHHIVRLWPSKEWLVRSDFIYSAVEFAIVTGYPIAGYLVLRLLGVKVIDIVAGVLLWLSVGTSFFLTIWKLHTSRYRTFRSSYDFMENDSDTLTRQRGLKGGRWSLVFGVNMFRRRFGTDRVFVRGLRAVVSMLSLLGMIALGYLVLILQPIQQHGYFRSTQVSEKDRGYTDGNVRLGVDPFTSTLNNSFLPPAFELDFDITWRPESQHVPCRRGVNSGNGLTCDVWSPFSTSSPDNLVIKINFTRALQQFSTTDLRTGVYLYFYTDSQGVDDFFPVPIQLYPGFHLFGTTFYSFRDRYANVRDLTFGIPQYDRYLVLNIQALVPDPEFANSNLDNTTATLRLTYQGNLESVQRNYEVQKEQSSDSVVNGFALVGGAWTFINGVFATVFGCRLLLVLFGIKPLSIYGLVHLFQHRRSLVDSGYTLSAEEQNRIIAVLREHLLDNDDDSGGPRTGKAGEENGRDETREDGGSMLSAEEQDQAYDVSREHLLDGDRGDLEADVAEDSKRGMELKNLRNTVQ